MQLQICNPGVWVSLFLVNITGIAFILPIANVFLWEIRIWHKLQTKHGSNNTRNYFHNTLGYTA